MLLDTELIEYKLVVSSDKNKNNDGFNTKTF